jgi:predicted acylesterase/phospholipase RssA
MDRTSNTAWAHLILAGAGVLSLSYAGALTVLHERGIRFRSVSSCSAGTLIGALLCARGTPEGLIKDVQNFSLTRLKGRRASPLPWLFSVHPLFKWPFALYRSPGFSEAFRDRIGGDPTFKDLKIHLPSPLSTSSNGAFSSTPVTRIRK